MRCSVSKPTQRLSAGHMRKDEEMANLCRVTKGEHDWQRGGGVHEIYSCARCMQHLSVPGLIADERQARQRVAVLESQLPAEAPHE